MRTTKLQQEFIGDEFQDCVETAINITGFLCSDTLLTGDREKGDGGETKYQILPDPYSAKTTEQRIELQAFEHYFYENYGKWEGRAYFDTPTQAFFHLIKAWNIWKEHLEKDIKRLYIEQVVKL